MDPTKVFHEYMSDNDDMYNYKVVQKEKKEASLNVQANNVHLSSSLNLL